MPDIEVNGTRLHYIDEGQGDEVLVFAHSYLMDHRHFAPQIEALSARYRVIAYDHRGHGQSDKSSKDCSMETIYQDGIGLLDALQIESCHWVGLSTGGFVGMRIAIRRPERLRSLVLMDTSAETEPMLGRLKYSAMFALVRVAGFGPVLGTAMQALFGTTFMTEPGFQSEREEWRKRLLANDKRAVIRFGLGIFAREAVLDAFPGVTTPTLVIVGEEDEATPVSKARRMAEAIPGARLEIIPRAGHISTLSDSERVTALLEEFVASSGAGLKDE
jgi:pimeloyl-ACP methyl ester carboxylesterase